MQKYNGTGYRLPHADPASITYLDAELIEN